MKIYYAGVRAFMDAWREQINPIPFLLSNGGRRRQGAPDSYGAVLALRFAHAAGVDAYIVDPVTVDEWQPCARLSGTPLIERIYTLDP